MLISILIPCFNAERWIAQAIESALGQSWAEKEVIVVDDGSTDRSLEIIKRFDGRVRWHSGSNQGGNRARNLLLCMSRGEWLQYLDADDYLLPGKLERQARFIDRGADADVVFGPVVLEHCDGTAAPSREYLHIPEPHDPWVLLARWWLPQTGACLWRKRAIEEVGGWNPTQPCCQEHELYLRLLMGGKKLAYCEGHGAIYRQWGDHTVCKRNIAETWKRRLEIEDRAERYLAERSELTDARLDALNQARFEIARAMWPSDRAASIRIVDAILASQPGFAPSSAAAAPRYRALYRWLGFDRTEAIAGLKRRALARVRPF